MLHARSYQHAAPETALEGFRNAEMTRRCRASAERWVAARRAKRAPPMRHDLPRIATS